MKAVDWQYCDILDKGYYPPKEEDLRRKAYQVLFYAAFRDTSHAETGGFVAKRYKDGRLSLHFCLEKATTKFYKPTETNC